MGAFVSFFCCVTAFSQEADSLATMPPTAAPYQWVSYQLKANITDSEETTNSVQIFVVNRIDSIIYVNLNKFGFELARLVLTPDSLVYVNKLEKNYFSGSYDFLQRRLGVPCQFSLVQALINGLDFADFQPFTQTLHDDNGTLHFIAPRREHRSDSLAIMQEIELDAHNRIVSNELTDLRSMQTLNIFYKNWQQVADFQFFTKMNIELEDEELVIDAELRNLRFNVVGPTEIRIPEKFTKIEK